MKILRYFTVVAFLLTFLMIGGIAKADIADPGNICSAALSIAGCSHLDTYRSVVCGRLVYGCYANIGSIISTHWFYIGLFGTILVECLIIGLLNGWKRKMLLKVAGINILTYISLTIFLVIIGRNLTTMSSYTGFMVLSEVVVILVEAVFFWLVLKWSKVRSLGISALANTTSVAVGLVIGWLLSRP